MYISGSLNGKTVAITGASGYIGSALVDRLMESPLDILRVSRQELAPRADVRTIKADVRTLDCWLEIIKQADVVFHLAGNTSVHTAVVNPADSLSSTLLPITQLIRAAQELGRQPRVVFASTATVYGLTAQFPVAESVEPKPITVYDMHKLFAEQQLALATQQRVLCGISLRLANVYGPSPSVSSADDRGILNRVTSRAIQGKDLTVYGDGNYLRDYVYIDDVTRAFMVAGLRDGVSGGVFNVATGNSISIRAAFQLVVQRVANVTGNRVDIKNIPWPEGANPIELRNFTADINYITDSLSWRPKISLESGIDCMIDGFIRSAING
jgi:nucleoside-diphosphate-sugar epimerase